jgi:hypothetical protein
MRDIADEAWYLYGIVRAPRPGQEQHGSDPNGIRSALDALSAEGITLQLVDHADVAAVVKLVPRHEFTDESLQERLRDPVALEAMARAHNHVIATVHGQETILPAKLGGVYARLEDVQLALEQTHDVLRAQLDRLEGCDEWAVHMFADRATVQRHVAAQNPSIRQLREDLQTARPGRAYFLQRKLAADLAAVTEQTLEELARTGYNLLAQSAVAGQISPMARQATNERGEIELLRAAFLVPRARAPAFVQTVDSLASGREGVRSEYSGPWPPYSFAAEGQL